MNYTNELECTLCNLVFADEEAFDTHHPIVCDLEGLVRLERNGKEVWAKAGTPVATNISIKW